MTQFIPKEVEPKTVSVSVTPQWRQPPEAVIRTALARAEVLCLRIIGAPGTGKTELIKATLKRLAGPRRVAVIAVNPASARDAGRLRDHCGLVAHIDAAVPDASAIGRAISELRLADLDMIIIEGSSGMAPLTDVGQDATIAAFSTTGGDDKAAEYHTLLSSASIVVLTKSDAKSLIKFNDQVFRDDVRAVNSNADIYELSAVTGMGMESWMQWVNQAIAAKKQRHGPPQSEECMGDSFIG